MHEFEQKVPYLLENRLRVERMDDRNLFKVVGGTLKSANIGIEDPATTIGLILNNIRDKKEGVDLTNLQVYLDRVYRSVLEKSPDNILSHNTVPVSNNADTISDTINDTQIFFTPSVVQRVGAMSNVISQFLDEQFGDIETRLNERGVKPSKGVPLEILFTLISNDNTKRQMNIEAIMENLPQNMQIKTDDIHFCLTEFKRIRILKETE